MREQGVSAELDFPFGYCTLPGEALQSYALGRYTTHMAQIQTQIREELVKAMKSKSEPRLTVMRGLVTAFTNELVALKRTPQSELSDEEALAVIRRAVKQRKDSVEQFEQGKRHDLAQAEREELVILQVFVPQMMSKEEIMKVAMHKKSELGLTEKAQSGLLMATLMKELRGKADGSDVKDVIATLLG